MPTMDVKVSKKGRTRRWVNFFVLFLFIWGSLTGSLAENFILGFGAAACAATAATLFIPVSSCSLRPVKAVEFIIFFLLQSLLSGIDVMRRAISFTPRINPGLIVYSTFLPADLPRVFFVNCISLLPGTLSAFLHNEKITIHLIDHEMPFLTGIKSLETRIGAMFGVLKQ